MTGRVAVIGAGVAGLATAYRLRARDDPPEVVVLEADQDVGGKIRSATVGEIELEAGPDSLLARKAWGVELCRELGLGDDLVAPAPPLAQVYTDEGLLPFPSGPFGISTDPMELWRWPGMSYRGKVRAARDLVLGARKDDGDESLGSLLRRRIGDEATEKLVAPLLGGLFAGDVDRLSVQATFPDLAAWERDHGSLMRGARAATKAAKDARRGPPPPMFLRLRGGLRRMTDALAAEIGPERIRLGTSATGVERDAGGYTVHVDGADDVGADAIVFATPASVTADLVRDLAPQIAPDLRSIPYVSTAVVLMVYGPGTGDALPESSGFVAPRGKLAITAATLVSRKWPDPSFGDRAVVRCFVGAAGIEELVEESDADIVEGVSRQLAAIFPLPGQPEAAEVARWPMAMPQYEVGHLDRVVTIEQGLPAGAYVVGQAYRGSGIPDCVRQANEVAARISAGSRDARPERPATDI